MGHANTFAAAVAAVFPLTQVYLLTVPQAVLRVQDGPRRNLAGLLSTIAFAVACAACVLRVAWGR